MKDPWKSRLWTPRATWPLLASLACGGHASDVVRVGTDVDAETLDARLLRNTTGMRVAGLIYDALIQLDASLDPVPDLAEHWEQVDSTTWVFHLRDDVWFHDGQPVTADDVVFTYETILDPALRSPSRTLYTPIRNIEALDEHTIRFRLREPYAPFLSYLDLGIVPKHLVEAGHDLGSEPIGSGPYALVGWDKGSRIRLRADSSHWSGVPSIARIDIVLVSDNTARAQAFEAGDLDLIQSPLAPQDVKRLSADARFSRTVVPGPAITYVNFNTARPYLRSVELRRALVQLIDQQTILEEIYEGMDQAASSILLPTSWAFTDSIQQPRYNPREADSTLRALGWSDAHGDGRLSRNGRSLSITLGTHIEDANRVQTVEYIQNEFERHGITTSIELSDWAAFSAARDAGNYDVILLGWTQIVDPDRVTFETLHSAGGLNWGRYRNSNVDDALVRARRTSSRAARIDAYRTAATIIANEVPYFVLSYQGYQVFLNPRLAGYEPNARGRLRSLARAHLRP